MPTFPPLRERMALLMPTTSPDMFTSGPPELPGLMAASVCRKSSYGPWPIERPLAQEPFEQLVAEELLDRRAAGEPSDGVDVDPRRTHGLGHRGEAGGGARRRRQRDRQLTYGRHAPGHCGPGWAPRMDAPTAQSRAPHHRHQHDESQTAALDHGHRAPQAHLNPVVRFAPLSSHGRFNRRSS